MLLVIVTFLLHCAVCFLLHYCCDTAKIWANDDQPDIHMPKLTDLGSGASVREMQKYTEEIISPTYHYFMMKRKIESYLEVESFTVKLSKAVLLLSTSLLFASALEELKFLETQWLYIVIALSIGVLSYYLTLIIYKKTSLPLLSFNYSIDRLKEDGIHYSKYNTKFIVCEDKAINNYIIIQHNEYLRSIYDTIIFRSSLRKVLFAISAVVYFLCFMRIPY